MPKNRRQSIIDVGSVILAPGFEPFIPSKLDNYIYAEHPNVITAIEFERFFSASGPTEGHLMRPSDHKEPEKIAWLQCIGSRDENLGRGYCSSVCCTYAIKEAMLAKEHSSIALDTAIFYIDVRTHGKDFEACFNRAKEELGVCFIKSKVTNVAPVNRTDRHLIRYVDATGKRVEEEFDIVVLSVGLGITEEAVHLAQRLDVTLDPYGFVNTGSFEPISSSRSGIYVCGTFQFPKDIPSSVIDADAAAGVAGSKLSIKTSNVLIRKGNLIMTGIYPET